jgi:hypothetical protein
MRLGSKVARAHAIGALHPIPPRRQLGQPRAASMAATSSVELKVSAGPRACK